MGVKHPSLQPPCRAEGQHASQRMHGSRGHALTSVAMEGPRTQTPEWCGEPEMTQSTMRTFEAFRTTTVLPLTWIALTDMPGGGIAVMVQRSMRLTTRVSKAPQGQSRLHLH